MSNGHACCILGVCCPPGGRVKRATALAEEMERAGYGKKADNQAVAGWLLDTFDFVPKGLGAAIVETYRPEFAKLHSADPPNPEAKGTPDGKA